MFHKNAQTVLHRQGLQGAEYMVSYLWKPMSMSTGVVLSLELGPKH